MQFRVDGLFRALLWLALSEWALLATRGATGEPRWQIGVFDGSSAEFRQWIHPSTGERQVDYPNPRSDPFYLVGRSVAGEDWLAFQPGSGNGGAGHREHPATVLFELASVPEEDLQLRVGLLSYAARLSVLQVELNGRRGWFYQEPRLAYSAGDPAVFFQPHYATSVITCRLAADWFRVGTNRLVLTAVDDPADREDARPSGFPLPGSSGLIYDAVALEAAAGRADSIDLEVRIEPTVFYRERGGRLFEEVELTLRSDDRRAAGGPRAPRARLAGARVSLEVAGVRVEGAVPGSREFGEERLILEVPAWEGTVTGRLQVAWDGRVHEVRQPLTAARRWTLSVVPHEHLDVGYTDYDAKIAELHSRVVDDALEGSARDQGFAFTVDGSWVIEEYLKGRSESGQRRLWEAIREGRLFMPVVHGSLFTGSASLEGLIRNLYPSRRLAREHGLPYDVAIVTDVPSYSWSFASVLAAAGVKYFVGASDAYRGPFLLNNRLHEASPHAWEGPDGGRVLTWYSRHYHQFASLFGVPPRVRLGRDSLPRFLQAYDRPEYRASRVILYGTQVENVMLQPQLASFAKEWNRVYAYPRMEFGGFAKALDEIVAQQGELPVVRGDGGPYWEDGLAANARVTALARSNARRLLSAEKAATLAALVNDRYVPDQEALSEAWRHSLLIDEHTWHADCSVRDPDSDQARIQGEAKDAHATDARRRLDWVLRRSLSALGDRLTAGPGSLVLFNPVSWSRRAWLEVEVGRGQGLVDVASGEGVPVEVVRTGRVYQRVRLVSPEIPGMGVCVLGLRPVPAAMAARATGPGPTRVLENEAFRVTLDAGRGGLASVFDKALECEWVDPNAAYALGQFLYVTGGDELPNRIVQYSTVSPIPALGIHPAGDGRLEASGKSGAGEWARLISRTRQFPRIETEVVLPAGRREIRLTVRLQKEASRAKEAAYVAFPLAVVSPRFRYATQNGWVDPSTDLLPGAGREWFTVQDWLAVEGRGRALWWIPIDAPLVTLGDIVRGTWPADFGDRPATVFSYLMSNYTPEGYAAAQGGEFEFRYVLGSGPGFDAGQVARFGAEAMTPVEVNEITRSDKLGGREDGVDPAAGGWLAVDPAEVHVVSWKAAEDGRGRVVRLLETAGRAVDAELRWREGVRVESAWRCTAVEDDLEPVAVNGGRLRVKVPACGIVTLRLLEGVEGGRRRR